MLGEMQVQNTESDSEIDDLQRRYEHYKVGYRRYKQRFLRSAMLAAVLGVGCFVLVALFVSANLGRTRLESDNQALRQEVAALDGRLAGLASRLLENAPTGLSRIEYGKLIPLDESYVRAVELSKPGFTSNGGIRFQLLVENRESSELVPDVSLELFDYSGSAIVAQHTLDLDSLSPIAAGTSRSISGRFDRTHPHAAFFRISVN